MDCKCLSIPQIKVKKLVEDAIIPLKMSKGASGFDLCAVVDTVIFPNKYDTISTGLAFDIPDGFELQVRSRSGLASKQGISVLNSPGTIDSDYKGEVKVVLINNSDMPYSVLKGSRIAQLVVSKVPNAEMVETSDALTTSERNTNGFGSTGMACKNSES